MEVVLNGATVELDGPAEGCSLLDALRTHGIVSAKDGCAPQGQCGCCTVWIDDEPRLACVTPLARAAGRRITTLEGLPADQRDAWVDAFLAAGASQCGFCTPGIIMRLAATVAMPQPTNSAETVTRCLNAHLCRCTGWTPIIEAACEGAAPNFDTSSTTASSSSGAALRATLETGAPQHIDRESVCGGGGFSSDVDPQGPVARRDEHGNWHTSASVAQARREWPRVQGRNSTRDVRPPIEVPDGPWDLVLATSWIEPAAVEPEASYASPTTSPTAPAANGGAFGSKSLGMLQEVAAEFASSEGHGISVVETREDSIRLGAKRPPLALGCTLDGKGVVRLPRCSGAAELVDQILPGMRVEYLDLAGPPVSLKLRGALWAELSAVALVLDALRRGLMPPPRPGTAGTEETAPAIWTTPRGPARVYDSPQFSLDAGGRAEVQVIGGRLEINLDAGDPLDLAITRSYALGAAHQALGAVLSEGLSVDADGTVHSLTLRSLGILRAGDMPPTKVSIAPATGPARPIGDATFGATLAAVWWATGLAQSWPLS